MLHHRRIVRLAALLLLITLPVGTASALHDGLQDDAESRFDLLVHDPTKHVIGTGEPLGTHPDDHCLACHLFRLLGQVTLVAGASVTRSSTATRPPVDRVARRDRDPAHGAGSRAPPRSACS